MLRAILRAMGKRGYGTGQLYEKHGSWYGRWRTADGRQPNRRLGAVRVPGAREGFTRAQAEKAFRKLMAEDERRPRLPASTPVKTIGDVSDLYRKERELEGASKSYLETIESIQRVHLVRHFGERAIDKITVADVEALATSMLRRGLAPKTVRNVLGYLHSLFELAVTKRWCRENPVTRAVRPKRRRAADSEPDLQFLTRRASSRRCCARSPTTS